MNRKKGPALYELITSKQIPSTQKPVPAQSEHYGDEDNLDHNVLAPGRSVRMSIGTICVLGVAGILLIVGSYVMGFQRGSAIAREDYRSRLFEDLPSTSFSEAESITSNTQSPTIEVDVPIDRAVKPKNQQNAPSEPSSWGAIHTDPRVAGYYYFILIQTTEEGATQLATFCRERGLETYVISGNNTQFHRVIAFPGSSVPGSDAAGKLKSKILAIGRDWAKTSVGRGSDLQDAYESLNN